MVMLVVGVEGGGLRRHTIVVRKEAVEAAECHAVWLLLMTFELQLFED